MIEPISDFKARILKLPLERQIEAVKMRQEQEKLESFETRLKSMSYDEQMAEYRAVQDTKRLNPYALPPSTIDTLPTALFVSVSIRIMEIKARGGPNSDDYASLRPISELLAEHGDDLLFKSKVPGRTAEIFNKVAQSIAILSFSPGGITLFGQKWGGD